MRLDWATPFVYVPRDPGWKLKVFVGGLWLLLFPPVGWPIALGYRKEALVALVEGRKPLLPPWKGETARYLTEGVKAVGVILVYFIPFLLIFWLLGVDHWLTLHQHAVEFGVFFVATVLLVPICLPLLPPLYWYLFPWIQLSSVEMVMVGIVFWVTTFLMPAAFLQVSLTGDFSAAFRFTRVLEFIAYNTRVYLEAWCISLLATGAAFVLGPAAPWGIFWSYLVIIYTFNEALFQSATPEVQNRFKNSYFLSQKAHERK